MPNLSIPTIKVVPPSPSEKSREHATSQQSTAIAITHVGRERLENLTLRGTCLSKGKETTSAVANCSTKQSDPEITIDSLKTKSRLRATSGEVKSTLKYYKKPVSEPQSVRYSRQSLDSRKVERNSILAECYAAVRRQTQEESYRATV